MDELWGSRQILLFSPKFKYLIEKKHKLITVALFSFAIRNHHPSLDYSCLYTFQYRKITRRGLTERF
ncbi:MAG: hypothetical protein M9898_05725 [Chitinophagaceae bacterium]|nr:hypothetical protein [Chitinophagaceae bacterium]